MTTLTIHVMGTDDDTALRELLYLHELLSDRLHAASVTYSTVSLCASSTCSVSRDNRPLPQPLIAGKD